jgi:hypothetical protein
MCESTLDAVIEHLNQMGPCVVNVTGGEITQHPDWLHMVTKLAKSVPLATITLLSNGHFITDQKKTREVCTALDLPNVVGMQVSAYKKYYPRYEKIKLLAPIYPDVHKKIVVGLGVAPPSMAYLGRAKLNGIKPYGKKYVGCCNLVLSAVQTDSWIGLNLALAQNGKFCVPLIDTYGSIHIGESNECRMVGTVLDSLDELHKKASEIEPCMKCGLVNPFDEPKYFLLRGLKKGSICLDYSPGSSSCSFVPAQQKSKAGPP